MDQVIPHVLVRQWALTPPTVMESQRLTRVGPDEIRQHRDRISINAPMLRLLAAVGAIECSPAAGRGQHGLEGDAAAVCRPQCQRDGLRLVVHALCRRCRRWPHRVLQMFCRVGYCVEQPRTPQRALAGFVRA